MRLDATQSPLSSVQLPPIMPPRASPAPDKKFSLRNLRSRFKSTTGNGEGSPPGSHSDPEKLRGRPSGTFNPYDLVDDKTGLPYAWSMSPSTPQSGFPSPAQFPLPPQRERDLPNLPQGPPIPQIQIISVDYPKPPTPPPVLPPVTTVSSEVRSVDLPWNNSRPSTASPESAPPEQSRSVEETQPLTELVAPAAAADSQMVVYAEEQHALAMVEPAGLPVNLRHAEILDVSQHVHHMKHGINDLPIEIPKLVSVLDDVARIHPSISVVVLAFKAAYNMERTRRENDKRISLLFSAMMDMLSVLIQLKDIKDPEYIGPNGRPIRPRLESVSMHAASDIKECANACDTYLKKSLMVRVLRSQVWEERLTGFYATFTSRRNDFELALSIHTANTTEEIKAATTEMNERIKEMTVLIRNLYAREWTPSNEQQLARKIQEKGGAKYVEHNDTTLSELAVFAESSQKSGGPVAKLSGRSTKGSAFTLQTLKDELFEDWETAIQRNMETFEGKFALYQRQLQEELAKSMEENTSRIIDELNRGPHDKIKNEELRAIWKEMDWKLNVKARLFVMTLRDHYKERADSATASSYSPRGSGFPQGPSDDWAFEFINAKYLQPIMEAFDDDGSGYVTYQEVNDFVDERPASLGWSLPHWVAYWAVGWQITAGRYRDRIMGLFSHMFNLRPQIKAENRYWVDYYLRCVWPVAFELTQSLRPANVPDHIEDKFQAFAQYEEGRIQKNLEDIHYDIDALDTVYVVSGPGRIEKYLFPLLFLLIKRDIARFEVAKTKILHKEELLDAADSLLWVLKAVNYRYLDLMALAKQNHLNVDNQMRIIACGLFEYLHNSTSLWTWRNLQDLNEKEASESESPELDLEEVTDPNTVLNYPLQDEFSLKCSLYDEPASLLAESNVRTLDVVRHLIGEWNGFVYTTTQYPSQLMTSFRLIPDPNDQRSFRATGLHDGVSFEVAGRVRLSQSQRGRVNVAFAIRYAREYSTQFFNGFVDADSALVGTEGWEEDPATHNSRFVLRRIPARVMVHRPPPSELAMPGRERTRALWRFATQAVLHEVRRWFWSPAFFRERREVRMKYIELSTRFSVYGHKPDEEELVEWTEHLRRVLAVDASFYRILRDLKLKTTPLHDCSCTGCGGKIGGERVVCLDCLSAEPEAKTIDFCEKPACWAVSPEGVKGSHRHLPTHSVFKVRTVLHLRDVPAMNELAEKALNVSRDYFQASSVGEDEPQGVPAVDADVVGDALAYYEQLEPQEQIAKVKCSVCRIAVQQPCWFCIGCLTAEEQVYICDACESKNLLQCIACSRTYEQPSWYYGTRSSDNFMCNTCNWQRQQPPDLPREKQHTYLHALVRCTPKVEDDTEATPLTTDERIGLLEKTVSALDGRMVGLEDALLRIEQLLRASLQRQSQSVCVRCHGPEPEMSPS